MSNFDEAFGLTKPEVVEIVDIENGDCDIESDYNMGRDELRALINKGSSAIDDAVQAVSSTQEPKAISALAQLLTAQAGLVEKLMKHQEVTKKVTGKQAPQTVKNEVNIVTSGTMEQVLKGLGSITK